MEDYLHLEILSDLLLEGYKTNDIILILNNIFDDSKVLKICNNLSLGISLEESIKSCEYDSYFIEYFSFFLSKNEISFAIRESVRLCKVKYNFKQKLIKKLKYPLFLISFLLFFSIFVSIFLIPQVSMFMNQFNSQSTVQMISFKIFSIIPIIIFCMSSIFIILFLVLWYSLKNNRIDILNRLLKIKAFSVVIKKYYSIKFSLFYNELLKLNYSSVDALEFLVTSLVDSDISHVINTIYNKVKLGQDLYEVFKELEYFEDLLMKYILILENMNSINKNLDSYISLSTNIFLNKVDKIISRVIPLVYGFVGFFVVFIYISIILPLMNVIEFS